MDRVDVIARLDRLGVLATLYAISKEPQCVTDLEKTRHNPDGVGSYATVSRATDTLVEFGLAKKIERRSPRVTYFFEITEAGTRLLDTIFSVVES